MNSAFTPLSAPPSPDRLRWFRWLTEYCCRFAISRGGLYALVDGSGNVLGAAVTAPPDSVGMNEMSEEEAGIYCEKAGMELAETVLMNPRMEALGMWQQMQSHGLGSHLYVAMFAVAPEVQGRGCGKALLRFLGDVADADGVAAVLETAGARNVAFYGKSGFKETTRSPVGDFTHQGGGVGMIRHPVPAGSGRAQVTEKTKSAEELSEIRRFIQPKLLASWKHRNELLAKQVQDTKPAAATAEWTPLGPSRPESGGPRVPLEDPFVGLSYEMATLTYARTTAIMNGARPGC